MNPTARIPVASPTASILVIILLGIALLNLGADSKSVAPAAPPELPPPSNGAISPQNQADALHFVIAADRELYARAFSARPAAEAAPAAGVEQSPSPCELLRRAAESIQSAGAEFSYSLRSLHPIDPRNGPQTELEQRGLEFLARHPGQSFYGPEMLGGRRYFTAVYPDLPATASCVDCHDRRPAAAPHRHKVGEPLGGLVVRVPLEF